jgi:tryptophan synthase alpha chain
MNRYAATFAGLKRRNRIAFIPFSVAGDPDLKTSAAIFRSFIKAGADILEIGYPFSDPIADGPVNQRAAQRAIAGGINPGSFFAMIRQLRNETDVPFGLLTYANIIHHVGYARFCSMSAESGIDSILVADMPPEESMELGAEMRKHGLLLVHIVSELTTPERMNRICASATGFIYVVSRLGTTGVRQDFNSSAIGTIAQLRKATKLPLCVGFGISSAQHVAAVRDAGADGAIVGSRLVDIIEKKHGHVPSMLSEIERTVRGMIKATHKTGEIHK